MYDDTKRDDTKRNHTKSNEPSSDFLDDLCEYDYDYLGCCASATDCTGLIPAGMVSEDELLSYKDVYSFPPPAMVAEKERYEAETDNQNTIK